MNTVVPPPPPGPVTNASTKGNVGAGIGLAIALLVLVVPAVFVGAGLAELFDVRSDAQIIWVLAPIMFPGAVQYLWIVPFALWFHRRGKTDTANAMWITSGVILLLNGACYGVLALA